MNNRIIFLALALILLMGSVNAETFKQSVGLDLKVSCDELNCSEAYNVTIAFPNSSLLVDNQEMTFVNGYMLYSLNASQTSLIGTYPFYLVSETDYYSDSYKITQSGISPDLSQSLIYGIIFLFALAVFLALFIPGLAIDGSRKYNIQGLMEWNGRVYLKIFALAMSDLAFVFLTFIVWRMAYYFLPLDFVSQILRSIFIVNMVFAPIVMIVGFIIVVTLILFDKNARDLMARGINPNEYRR